MIAGLTDAEVAQRVADGKSNAAPERATRSVTAIVRANVFTRINAMLGVLLVIVLATGSVINGLFGLLIVANSVIGMGCGGRGPACSACHPGCGASR
jgi:cation-transporting P-type ATPase E